MMQFVTRIALWAGGAYLVIGGLIYALQGYLVYVPDRTRVAPALVGLPDVTERKLAVAPGVVLISWYGQAQPGKPTLLYFHGNGANLAARADRIRFFLDRGIGVYMMSYRGYSGSGGTPSEAANVADARLAYQDLRALGVTAGETVLFGESLGTAIASRLAVDTPVAALVLDSPFTSITDIGASQYPWLPVRLLLRHRYETINIIDKVKVPLLVVHGEADDVVPVAMGRSIFAAARAAEPKHLVTFPGAGHSNHAEFGSMAQVVRFITEITAVPQR